MLHFKGKFRNLNIIIKLAMLKISSSIFILVIIAKRRIILKKNVLTIRKLQELRTTMGG